MTPIASVVILLADGARPDALDQGDARIALPALTQLRDEGGLHTVTTAFPSVTGPAYTPFLMGRFPGPVGLPGLRWYDRERTRCAYPHYARSYVGADMRLVDGDLDRDAPTVFELARSGLGAMSVIGRGLAPGERLGHGARFALRAARVHFRGNVRGWLDIDRDVAGQVVRHIDQHRPAVTFVALTGIDKTSHAGGHAAPDVGEALRIVDDTVASIRASAERAGRWEHMHLWVASDHGHSAVHSHDDLAQLLRADAELGVLAHPWVYGARRDAAVMVSGNAMAHLYLELERIARPWWPELAARWEPLASLLLRRPSVDLLILPRDADCSEVRSATRGSALVERRGAANALRYAYRPLTGDPLGLGEHSGLSADASHELTMASDYPDSLVQIAHLAGSGRAGEMILSAAPGWDFRARYEPIPHVSSHGALHRDHMLVPLLLNRPPARAPRRTTDVMPSALRALGLPIPPGLDGTAFN